MVIMHTVTDHTSTSIHMESTAGEVIGQLKSRPIEPHGIRAAGPLADNTGQLLLQIVGDLERLDGDVHQRISAMIQTQAMMSTPMSSNSNMG